MRTYPDFTWEWIIQSCEQKCNQLQHGQEFGTLPDRIQNYILSARGIIAIVPKLREHGELDKLVPMKSLMYLRWFPSKIREICLDYDESKGEYRLAILAMHGIEIESVISEKVVTIDTAADEVYALIIQLRDD